MEENISENKLKNRFNILSLLKNPSAVLIVVALVIVGLVVYLQNSGRVNFKSLENKQSSVSDSGSKEKIKVLPEESLVIDVVKQTSPSIVSIVVQKSGTSSLFSPFSGSQSQESGIGTGFAVDKNLILTNKHVVAAGGRFTAVAKDKDGEEKEYKVTEINMDPFNDLAILKIEENNLVPLTLGDSEVLQVGQLVIAVGNALGQFDNTVTTGVVSGLGRGITASDPFESIAERLDNLIQTDAAINPGNSGGPLLNSSGQVIGINTAVAGAQNIGFAIPINVAVELLDGFKREGGKIVRPFLGVSYTVITREVAILNELPEGIYVESVAIDSAADKVGLTEGDIITAIDGQKLDDKNQLSEIVRKKKVGDMVTISLYRDGEKSEMQIKLEAAPEEVTRSN
ncbi:trypsin-like peptidase domain-containing protein [Candidatus Curtissbacteria bacterium]|nr:trypsin-like peptidase domain-containing protein [Candidatus Curtissbacteria bacterium]